MAGCPHAYDMGVNLSLLVRSNREDYLRPNTGIQEEELQTLGKDLEGEWYPGPKGTNTQHSRLRTGRACISGVPAFPSGANAAVRQGTSHIRSVCPEGFYLSSSTISSCGPPPFQIVTVYSSLRT